MALDETVIIFHLINLFGIVGHILALLCIIKSPSLKSFTFKLLGNLTVVDLLSSLYSILIAISNQFIDLDASPNFMKFLIITNVTYVILVMSSIYLLVAVSFHRFVGFPSFTHLKMTIVIIWIVSFVVAVAYAYAAIYKPYMDYNTSAIFWAILAYSIPLVLILLIFCCGKIGRNHHLNAPSRSNSIEGNIKEDALTIMVVIVIVIHFCLWLPAHFLNMKLALFSETEEFFERYELYNNIAHLNDSIRPFLYFLLSADMRSSLMDLICCRSRTTVRHPIEMTEAR